MAGVNVGTAYLEIIPSARGFAGKLQGEVGSGMASAGTKAGKDASDGFGRSFKGGISNAAKAGALALAAVAAGGTAFIKSSIGEARESQKVGALTTQVIKSTGGAAKVTAGQVGDLATAISNKTGIDDEAIQSASNLLLTFTNVHNEVGKGNDVFNQATQAATDMGAALGGDPKSSAIQLGKALNDPVKGVTALSKVGVSFTAQQKDQIKTLVKSGKTLDAQKIILGELNKEFGGAAAASATAGEKMSVAWGNFKEGIGTSLLPVLDKVEGFITSRLLPGIQGVIDVLFKGDFTKGFREAFKVDEDSAFVGFLFGVRDTFKEIVGGVKAFGAAWKANDGDVTSSGFPGLMERIANFLRTVTGGVRAFAAAWVAADGDITSSGFAGWMEKVAGVVRPIFDEMIGGVKAFGAAWMANDGDITSSGFPGFMEKVAGIIRPLFDELVGGIKAFAAAWVANDGEVTSSGFAGFMEKAANSGRRLFDYLKTVVPPIGAAFAALWPPIRDVAVQLYNAYDSIGFSTWDLFKAALSKLPAIIDHLTTGLAGTAKWMGEHTVLIGALVTGIATIATIIKVVTVAQKAWTIATEAYAVAQRLVNIAMRANPIGIVITLIAALAAGLIYAYQNSETFRSYVTTAFSMIKLGALSLAKVVVMAFQMWANVWMTVVGALLDGAAKAFGWVPGIGPKLQGAAKAFGTFKDSANAKLNAIQDDINIKISTEQASIALEELHREFLDKGWTVTAEVNTKMVYGANGQLVPAHASGGPLAPGLHVVGDNPDGSWNKTTELLGINGSGRVFNQSQIKVAPAAGALEIDYDRLAFAMSRVRVIGDISPSALDRTMGAR